MFTVNVTYIDFDDQEYTERLYFNMTKVEFMRWQAESGDNLTERMKTALEKHDSSKIMDYFEELIRRSYGEKSDDGKRFVKDPQKTRDFMTSAAYDELFWRITQNQEECNAFMRGVLPNVPPSGEVKQNAVSNPA